jgi:hypothetical protein
MQARLLLGGALLVTVLLYWVGLHGPFLLDDLNNLGPLQQWLAGQATWQQAIFGNHSGMFGRPVSMASLALSAWLGGFDPFAFKLGNLIAHLACGVLGWQVLRRALAEDKRLAGSADLIATLLVALWLLHPLNVSTVLYPVQRMAQMSTLFVLASLWAYLDARRNLAAGEQGRALVGLFVLFPLLLFAGLLSKENAAVAPALCLVLELAYFTARPRTGRALPAFFGIFVALPAVLLGALLVFRPGRLLGGYVIRDFSLMERVLSEPRALIDYIGLLLFPRSPRLGLFTDDFTVSTGLLAPPSTLLAIIALLAITGLAIVVRKRAPSVFAGWLFFLVAHAVESTILPLELYFEHRNYLPAFGFWLAVVGLCELLTRNLPFNVLSPRKLGLLVAGGFVLVFGFGTLGRAWVWQQPDMIIGQALKSHPGSLRANMASLDIAVARGDYVQSQAVLTRWLANPDPRAQMAGRINRVTVDCIFGMSPNPNDLQQAAKLAQPKAMLSDLQTFEMLAKASNEKGCGAVSPGVIADGIDTVVDAATAQPDSVTAKWQLRLLAARMYGRANRWDDALTQARLAWQHNADAAAGGYLAIVYAQKGMLGDAERIYEETSARIDPHKLDDIAGLAGVRKFLDQQAANTAVESSGSPPAH